MNGRGIRGLWLLVALGVVAVALDPSGVTAAAAIGTIVDDTGQDGWMCPPDVSAGATAAVSPQQEASPVRYRSASGPGYRPGVPMGS